MKRKHMLISDRQTDRQAELKNAALRLFCALKQNNREYCAFPAQENPARGRRFPVQCGKVLSADEIGRLRSSPLTSGTRRFEI